MKNYADALIFHTAICFWAKTNSSAGRREIACANFSSPLRDKPLRNEDYDEDINKRKICNKAYVRFGGIQYGGAGQY